MSFEDFESVFGEPKAEWSKNSDSGSVPLRRFLMQVLAPDYYHLAIQVSDFHSNTFETVRSVAQLEDLRDAVGIVGSLSEFVEYTITSIKQDVKLVLDKHSCIDGAMNAKLVAQKSKGMPLISISLTKLSDSAAHDAMESISFGLFKASKFMRNLLVQEKVHLSGLTNGISAEQEKRRKLLQMDSPHNIDTFPSLASSGSKDPPDMQATRGAPPPIATNRVVPAFRRAKVRGALLKNTDEEEKHD